MIMMMIMMMMMMMLMVSFHHPAPGLPYSIAYPSPAYWLFPVGIHLYLACLFSLACWLSPAGSFSCLLAAACWLPRLSSLSVLPRLLAVACWHPPSTC